MTPDVRVRLEHLWLALPIAVLVWFSFLRPVGLLDFWWHLKAGELIVATRSLPRVDLFSFTCAGKPFVLQSWLVELLYYAVYRVGGLPLILAVNTALLVAAFLPIYDLCLAAAGGVRRAVVAASMSVASLLTFGNVRSQVVSFVCFSATYWIVDEYRRRGRDRLWALPPLMIVWVNVHGAFVVGLALIGVVLAAETVRRVALGPHPDTLAPRDIRRLGYVFVVVAVATLANPEGARLYSAIASVSRARSFVTEWQTPGLDGVGITAFYGPLLVSLVVFACARQRPGVTDVVLFLAFAAFGFTALRNAVWFVLVSSPIVARCLRSVDVGALVRRLPGARRPDAAPPERARRPSPSPVRYGLNAAIAIVMVAVAVVLSPWVRPLLSSRGRDVWLDARTPVGAVDYLARRGIRDRVFHPEIYGDYLVWRLWPRQRSFVDSRIHLFSQCPSVLDDYDLTFADSHWDERLARYGVRYLMLSKEETNDAAMIERAKQSSGWRVVYEDRSTVIFEKSLQVSAARAGGGR